jgi:hypothetical protein
MHDTKHRRYDWTSRSVLIGMGGLLFLGGYLLARGVWPPPAALAMPAQAAESHKESTHEAHQVELAPVMIRNAYHLATLYHAARAAHWELAAYQAEELEENLLQAAPGAGPYAQFIKDYSKDYIAPLQQAIAAQNAAQFRTAFQGAVEGCNDCHKATQHAFITIPQEPPNLSIFVLPPVGR